MGTLVTESQKSIHVLCYSLQKFDGVGSWIQLFREWVRKNRAINREASTPKLPRSRSWVGTDNERWGSQTLLVNVDSWIMGLSETALWEPTSPSPSLMGLYQG